MKGPLEIPSQKKLVGYYKILQSTKIPLSEKILFQMIHDSRWDPRLHEQLIQHIEKHWEKLSALRLNQFATESSWPATLAVTLEILAHLLKSKFKHNRKYLRLYAGWMDLACTDIAKANEESYYIGHTSFAGIETKKDLYYNASPFSKWGYLCRDLPISLKTSQKNPNMYSLQSRKNLLLDLFKTKQSITITDYLDKINNCISCRQAERDLKAFKFVKKYGRTKARRYSYL